MPPGRAADRSAASSSTPASRRSERLLPPCPDCGSTAAARRPPGDAPRSALRRSRRYRCRSRHGAPRLIHADGANLVSPAGIDGAEIARDAERLVEIPAIDNIEAEQLFLGL